MSSFVINRPTVNLASALDPIEKLIGNTPLFKLNFSPGNLYTKLEYQNCFGSIKDRPALYIIKNALLSGLIDEHTTIVESTSGNFGLALAGICKALGIKFIPVIDPNISAQKEQLLRMLSYKVIKVTERDETGGYLLNRIKVVKEFLQEDPHAYNPNQYENPNNYLAYYNSLGEEICRSFDRLEYAFISVSSCGTIIGVSQRLKEKFPNIKVIGVDVEGSMIFSNRRKARKLSGIGASKQSPLIHNAHIDDAVILSEKEIVAGCQELLSRYGLLTGASSGAAYVAAKRILLQSAHPNPNAVFITPDSGNSYLDTVFSKEWVKENIA
jgi:N-(2-amino-2-carboxyethyl)-L-glutamate synthase